MEKQMRAEREKRATVLTSEGQRDANINEAEGNKQQAIKASEGRQQQQINEAEGQAQAIRSIAHATAEGIRQVAAAIEEPGGMEAVQLRVAEQYVSQFGNLAQRSTTMIVPASVSDVAGMIAMAMNVFKSASPNGSGGGTNGANGARTAAEREALAAALLRRNQAGQDAGGLPPVGGDRGTGDIPRSV
jgi:uncharacterized membrane protein YqiK